MSEVNESAHRLFGKGIFRGFTRLNDLANPCELFGGDVKHLINFLFQGHFVNDFLNFAVYFVTRNDWFFFGFLGFSFTAAEKTAP